MAKTLAKLQLIDLECIANHFRLPGTSAFHFAKARIGGRKAAWEIITTVVEDQIREVV